MIFISGVHGVGKSYFCERVEAELGIVTFSASRLISERKKADFSNDKLIPDIDDNQQILLSAVLELDLVSSAYLLDGHFCLLNAEGRVTRIPSNTFLALKPSAIVLLTENPKVIAERRKQRDGIDHDIGVIEDFQKEEASYATEVAEMLGIPLKVSAGANDMDNTLDFIKTTTRRITNGR